MQKIKAHLVARIKRTATVESFRFIPEEPIFFKAGQFLQVVFDRTDPDNRQLNKYLSFSAAPSRPYFEITKRLSESAFSESLKHLKITDELEFNLPFGTCVLPETDQKIGFLIGGIGITPVISMIEEIILKKLDLDVALFYSNKTAAEVAFKEELQNWQKNFPNIRVIYTTTESEPTGPGWFFGRINQDLVRQKAPDFLDRKWFIFGPPAMVAVVTEICRQLGLKEEQIMTEKFIGY